MSETTAPVRPVQVDYLCDTPGCGSPMRPRGIMYPSYPPMYPHVCANGHRANLTQTYPYVRHEEFTD